MDLIRASLRAWFYNPELGRFISRDPFAGQMNENMYAYVENNPLAYTNPSGLDSIDTIYTLGRISGVKIGTKINPSNGELYLTWGVGLVGGTSLLTTYDSIATPSEGYFH